MQLIEEPVEVEERGGELVEDEGRAVEVDERALFYHTHASVNSVSCPPPRTMHYPKRERMREKVYNEALTNPNEKTTNAATACASNPHPKTPTLNTQMIRSHKKYPAANP